MNGIFCQPFHLSNGGLCMKHKNYPILITNTCHHKIIYLKVIFILLYYDMNMEHIPFNPDLQRHAEKLTLMYIKYCLSNIHIYHGVLKRGEVHIFT